MLQQVGQLFQNQSDIGMILQTLFSLSFIIYLFYAQRIQAMSMLRQVEGTLRKVKSIRDRGRKVSIETVKEVGKTENDPTPDVDRFIEHFMIPPVNLDPAGIVGKFGQLLNVREITFEAEVKAMAPGASESELNNLENLLEASLALNVYYKVIRHFYLLGRKTMNIYVIMQIHMILPIIMREIEAYSSAIQAFRDGMPIGDSVGALVAAKMMHGHEWQEVAKDMVAAEVPHADRTLVVIKAKGPGGTVGKPGDAIENIINGRKGKEKVKAVIMVDAAGKLEGEPAGAVAEGVGAAIGGIGVEKYKIEEAVKAHDIPMYAVAIKQDISHVVAPMVEELFKACDTAVEAVKRLVEERTQQGDVVLVVGIGNTIGVAQ
ncbi:MAG: DUF1512 domain-containing protein [Candidatus Bathyarchaeota archaeon]|jgi:hypothetical protein|nr:DUF1512 domain-containing protein [Candidatus Bathyarchaeota archaeon]